MGVRGACVRGGAVGQTERKVEALPQSPVDTAHHGIHHHGWCVEHAPVVSTVLVESSLIAVKKVHNRVRFACQLGCCCTGQGLQSMVGRCEWLVVCEPFEAAQEGSDGGIEREGVNDAPGGIGMLKPRHDKSCVDKCADGHRWDSVGFDTRCDPAQARDQWMV